MSDNKAMVWMFGLAIVAAFLFAGSPDMKDTLIAKLNATCTPEKAE